MHGRGHEPEERAPEEHQGNAADGPECVRHLGGALLERDFYDGDSLEVAPELLNKVLVRSLGDGAFLAGRIVEVEAYRGAEDAASHAYRGRTPRNATMFGEPGHLYVYFTYGMHFCANVVCSPPVAGSGGAVLLRALAPLCGLEQMRRLRGAKRGGAQAGTAAGHQGSSGLARPDRDLCSGPGKLCQALAITRELDGADLVGGRVYVLDDDVPPPCEPARGPRIGLGATVGEAASWPWRFAVPGDRSLSRPFPKAT